MFELGKIIIIIIIFLERCTLYGLFLFFTFLLRKLLGPRDIVLNFLTFIMDLTIILVSMIFFPK